MSTTAFHDEHAGMITVDTGRDYRNRPKVFLNTERGPFVADADDAEAVGKAILAAVAEVRAMPVKP